MIAALTAVLSAACALPLPAAAAADVRAEPQEVKPWTFMIYGAADNNADGPILDFLDQVRSAWAGDPGIEILLFLDRSDQFSDDATVLGEDFSGCRLYRLTKDGAERLEGGEHFPEIRLDQEVELDSGSALTVGKFLAWGKATAPARRYGLMIYGHADGTAMCPDHGGAAATEMGIAELSETVGEDPAVDLLALELCDMGGVEIAYQWRPGNGGFFAEVLVAIPNAGPPLDWQRAFQRLRTPVAGQTPADTLDPAQLDAADFGRLIVREGERGRRAMAAAHPDHAQQIGRESVGAYDLYLVEEVKEAVDVLARELVATGGRQAFESLRGPGHACCAMNYVGDQLGNRPYLDLYDLCRRATECEALAASVRELDAEVMEGTDALVLDSFGMDGFDSFQPGKNGVFIVFPDGESQQATGLPLQGDAWRQLGWYTPLRVHGGPWVYGSWAWCGDGAEPHNGEVENWFEMLDSWYDRPNPSGGTNGYSY